MYKVLNIMLDFLHQTFDIYSLIAIAGFTLITSAIHGATGVAGGFLLSAVLASIIGVKPIVPVMSVALLISHSSRVFLNSAHFDKKAFFSVIKTAVPCIILAALFYGRLSSFSIALILGFVILMSIPLRRWAKKQEIKASSKTLSSVGTVYGALSGVSVGPGLLLAPFLLGHGLSRQAFVVTLAAIALITNITRLSVFGFDNLLSTNYIILGVLIGVFTIPGNWIGRSYLRKMSNENHSSFVDVLTVLGAMNMFWVAFK
ncbi:MAG: TSUP family transporter [Nitratireductor sp.]